MNKLYDEVTFNKAVTDAYYKGRLDANALICSKCIHGIEAKKYGKMSAFCHDCNSFEWFEVKSK